ncbi:DUF4168 domain-containing protein [Calothrix rhizosoleniae]|uniref:DUF4168 domain-containing protein n=1 Tax=Calothrix rhizosoleniae TaxID=888997 RepID=UPI000B4A011C|nr:DUF4168 domain-containing protein [Calothrix rhizosoleniae]
MKKLSLLSYLQPILYKPPFFTAMAVISLVCTTLTFNSKVEAQNRPNRNIPSREELKNYAEVLLKMEPLRQRAFDRIKKTIPSRQGTVPKIVCNDRNSINGLPNQARGIAVEFCRNYQDIVRENKMDIERFNQITDDVRDNDELQDDIYEMLIDIQNNDSE